MFNLKSITISVLLVFCLVTYASEKSDEALRVYYSGDRGKGIGMFKEIIEEDPNDAEALWQLSYSAYINEDVSITKYATEIEKAAEFAFTSGDEALGHYILSQYNSNQNKYELALSEIDEAIALEPTSVRYLRTKMLILFFITKSESNIDLINKGLAIGDQGLSQIANDPKHYFSTGAFHFEIARWVPKYTDEIQELTIKHYQSAIEAGGISEYTRSYSWNNMSGALLKLGRCEEAKAASEKALSILDYRYARTNLAKAKKCLAVNNIFYRAWFFIKTWFKRLLGLPTECPELKCD